MWKRIMRSFVAVAAALLLLSLGSLAVSGGGGFDEYGYNYKARIFVGTGWDWCIGKGNTEAYCTAYIGPWADDHLVMKWSKAWDDARFHGGDWTTDAWCSNEWNGMAPGGSGETWHYKIVWVGPELENSPYWRDGGYPIWGQFEVVMSHGTVANEHFWEAHALPSGYGWP